MKIKASGRSALILAAGLWVCFARTVASRRNADGTAASSTAAAPTAPDKSAKHASRHWKKYAHHKSGRWRRNPRPTRRPPRPMTPPPTATNHPPLPSSEMPSSVANANARTDGRRHADRRRRPGDVGAGQQHPAGRAGQSGRRTACRNPGRRRRSAQRCRSRAARSQPACDSNQPPATLAMASAEAPVVAGSAASSSDSTWDQTSLIGKIFIGFGALLTMASAARMFMA